MKRCVACKVTKPLAEFSKNRAQRDGIAGDCKACSRERVRKWKAANPERAAASAKAHYARTADQQRAKARAWHHANKDRAQEQGAAWRAANREKIKSHKRRQRTGFTDELLAQALQLQANACAICAIDFAGLPAKHIHADHCHTTGAPRGVLCHHCNVALGYFRDSEAALCAALAYLANPPLGGAR